MRTYSDWAGDSIKKMLELLSTQHISTDYYRQLMEQLGHALAEELLQHLAGSNRILLICTNEDADFLARGILCLLEKIKGFHVSLACFWNDRKRVSPSYEVAPIIRRYVEPSDTVDTFVVVKSIISSSCVVRSNISELIYESSPRSIFILSPVLLTGAKSSLESEFDFDISKRFKYLWIAEDDQSTKDGQVIPGIGGSVYELLGIGTSATKNQYIPNIVTERRARFKQGVMNVSVC